MYEYNPKGFEKHIEKKTFSKRSLADVTKASIPTVLGWTNEGRDLYLSKLLQICNHYQIPLGDFIRENGVPVSAVYTDDRSRTEIIRNISAETANDVAEIMRYEEQMESLKKQYEDKMNSMEKDFLTRIGDVREAAAEKWAKKNAESLQAERKSLETKYEKRLKEQNDEIMRLREENAVLRSQVKTGFTRTYPTPDVLSEHDTRGAKP